MNYKKHMAIFGLIAAGGFVLFFFTPQFGAATFLPALGALLGARKAQADGPAQPRLALWGAFFGLAAVAVLIRYLVPEENFGGFEMWPESLILWWLYVASLALAFPLFGYLAYLQRVGRTSS
jgi:hypothetical protein